MPDDIVVPTPPTLGELYTRAKRATSAETVFALLERLVELEEPSLKIVVPLTDEEIHERAHDAAVKEAAKSAKADKDSADKFATDRAASIKAASDKEAAEKAADEKAAK